MKKISVFTAILLVICTAGLSFIAFALFLPSSSVTAKKTALVEKWIETYYIDEYDEQALADAAVAAMVQATGDPWSYYIPASQMQNYLEDSENKMVGVGIHILDDETDAGFLITKVVDGPAKEAGIQDGDVLVAVDGVSVEELGTAGAKERIRGEIGTTVELTILRKDETLKFQVKRAEIQQIVASYEMLSGNIAYIRITDFEGSSASQTMDCIQSALQDGAEGLIFDVRFNPGGRRMELVALLDKILPEGELFRSIDYAGREEVDHSDATCVDVPMAVLVNDGTFSAAEFFAAALQEYEWATIVGEKTTGKGKFQTSFQLDDGSAIVLSIGKYFTPKGVSLAETGVTPDEAVVLNEEDKMSLYYGTLSLEDDEQLSHAVSVIEKMLFAESS